MTRLPKRTVCFLQTSLLFFSLLCISIGCKKGFNEYYSSKNPKGGYLYDRIKSNSNFTTFAQGLERANLVQYIDKGGLYTIFAPTNDAFSKFLAANGYGTINDVPVEKLFNILSFHIVNNMWYYYDLKLRYATYNQRLYLTRNKKFVNIDVTIADSIKVNAIPVINSLRDIDADNGVIHGISDVMIPLSNLEKLLASDTEFANSTFYKLMQVVADSAYDRFNSYDKDRDGRIDSVFYKTYPLLDNVNTSLEFRLNTAPDNQGGDPVFTTVLMPSNDSLNKLIAPALARIDPAILNKIAALSPSYAEAVLESYFIYDTISFISSAKLMAPPAVIRSVNYEAVPILTIGQFLRKDIVASNGAVHVLDRNFPLSDRMKSAIGQATMDPELSTFMSAVQKAGLMSTIESTARAGTYFAPTNAAFLAAGLDVKNMTLNGVSLTSTQFANIIKNHIIDQNLAKPALTGSINTNYGNGNTLTFTSSGTVVTTILGLVANITHPEVSRGPGNVGYVYKVDQVLIPRQQ